ncbi:leucine-rich repeat domain-containing protein [Lignipirellula cremea]|uniref:Leucine Rich repeats (2 copies) n=1 Tax=Lignipirellula cremea TaxID=2528010 RepID=A0A518DRX8_9BACT|nr:hypothetical protein [Lignipirellula cremea]QDU94600.1 hypothetical protein Pla8534_23930 [Lignipirellula cremea]
MKLLPGLGVFAGSLAIIFGVAYGAMLLTRGDTAENKLRARFGLGPDDGSGAGMGMGDRPDRDAPIPVNAAWKSREELLAADNTPLVEHTFEWEGRKYSIQAPSDAKMIVEDYGSQAFHLEISPTLDVSFEASDGNIEKIRQQASDNTRPKQYLFDASDMVVVEYPGDKVRGFDMLAVLRRGYVDFAVNTDNKGGEWGEYETREEALLALRCADSLKLVSESPTDLIEVLRQHQVRVDGDTPDEVTGLEFPSQATSPLHDLIEKFPNLERLSIYNGDRLTAEQGRQIGQLKKLTSLKFVNRSPDNEVIDGMLQAVTLEHLQLSCGNGEYPALTRLGDLKKLKTLELDISAENQSCLAKLAGLPDLRTLDLDVSAEKPPALVELGKVTQLTKLKLETQLADPCMVSLKTLTNLVDLTLTMEIIGKGQKVTDVGLSALSEMKALTHLKFTGYENSNFQITDQPFSRWASLPLETLEVDGLPIDDNGLKALCGSQSLTRIELIDSLVTDAGLLSLEKLASLKSIYLRDNKAVTEAGIEALKTARPMLSVSH